MCHLTFAHSPLISTTRVPDFNPIKLHIALETIGTTVKHVWPFQYTYGILIEYQCFACSVLVLNISLYFRVLLYFHQLAIPVPEGKDRFAYP